MIQTASEGQTPHWGPSICHPLGPRRLTGLSKKSFAIAKWEGYVEHPDVSLRTVEEVQAWNTRNSVLVLEDGGARLPKPVTSFEEACLPAWAEQALRKEGYVEPTAVQAVAWPLIRVGRDLVTIAETGCGKTLAYILPMVIKADSFWTDTANGLDRDDESRPSPPDGLVLVPTLELAAQVRAAFAPFAEAAGVLVAGGALAPDRKVEEEVLLSMLRSEAEKQQEKEAAAHQIKNACMAGVLVMTSKQLLKQRWIIDSMDACDDMRKDLMVVLDEADSVIQDGDDEGAEARTLVEHMPSRRQLLFFSATWPEKAEQHTLRHLHSAALLHIGAKGGLAACRSISQEFEVVATCPFAKLDKLKATLKTLGLPMARTGADSKRCRRKVLVFCNQAATVDIVVAELAKVLEESASGAVVGIHCDTPEADRLEILSKLQDGLGPSVLVATSLVGRGLHFANINTVINFDMSPSLVEYVHRIGRCGRCSSQGWSKTFLTKADLLQAADLISMLKISEQAVPSFLQVAAEKHLELVSWENPSEAARLARSKSTHIMGHGRGAGFEHGGDWLCPSCGDHQFSRNSSCRKCGAAKPQEAGTPRVSGNNFASEKELTGSWEGFRGVLAPRAAVKKHMPVKGSIESPEALHDTQAPSLMDLDAAEDSLPTSTNPQEAPEAETYRRAPEDLIWFG